MKISRESIFISAIRSLFNTFLGTFGVLAALIPGFILFSILTTPDQKEGLKNKIEILPDLNGSTKMLSLNTPVILQLEVTGIIGQAHLTAKDLNYQLIESRKGILRNNRVKAILIHVNSPGGDAIASDNMYRNLLSYKKKYNVPIYTYIDGICASGGFYIACASDKIYASPIGMIGSVGSRMGPFFNVTKALEKIGVETLTVTDGQDKDMMNPFRKWSKDEDKIFANLNKYVYNKFLTIVATSRNIDKDKLINEYGAKVFDPEKAKEIGYIDEANSSYDDVMQALLAQANIDKKYQVVTLHPKKLWFSPLLAQTKTLIKNTLKEIFVSLKYINSN